MGKKILCVNIDDGSTRILGFNDYLNEDFQVWEFVSRDCEVLLYSEHHINCLQALRNMYDLPVGVTNSFRTISHNDDVSDYEQSKHQYGFASDIVIQGVDPEEIKIYASEICGYWSQIITYKGTNHVHIGTDPTEHLRLYHDGEKYINKEF